jgi:hypothetical protein
MHGSSIDFVINNTRKAALMQKIIYALLTKFLVHPVIRGNLNGLS